MASVTKVSTGWRARWREPDGGSRSETFKFRKDAIDKINSVESEKLRGVYIDPLRARVTFRDYATGWQASQVHRATTASQVNSHLRNHLLPALGDKTLASVRPSQVQALVKLLSTSLAPATVEVVFRYLSAIFAGAVRDRLIPASPCTGVKLPKVSHPKVVPWPVGRVEALTDAMPPRYQALVVLAAQTGLRQGEVFGLTLANVDMLRRTVTVAQQLVTLAGREPYIAPPKTQASYRTVPLPEVALQALAVHLATNPAGPGGLIFTDDKDRPIRRNRFGEVWRRAVVAADLPERSHFHELRHHYASVLIAGGESVSVVQARLGHATASETLDTYSHLWPDSEDRTRAVVDLAWGSRVTAVSRATS